MSGGRNDKKQTTKGNFASPECAGAGIIRADVAECDVAGMVVSRMAVSWHTELAMRYSLWLAQWVKFRVVRLCRAQMGLPRRIRLLLRHGRIQIVLQILWMRVLLSWTTVDRAWVFTLS